jgi:cytochrome c-type biogenesis protein CcmH/NrfG
MPIDRYLWTEFRTRLQAGVLALLLAGCAGTVSSPAEEERPVGVSGDSGRAVASLLAKVDTQQAGRHWERAAALLERALRIEPRNARLWHRLAQVRLQQGRYAQAASLARKSNALAGDDKLLRSENARILEQVRAVATPAG